MKRLVSLALIMLLALSPAYAEAAITDFETASLDELLALRETLDAYIREKSHNLPFTLSQGVYVAGVDFPPGAYAVTAGANAESAFVYVYGDAAADWYGFERFYALGTFHACMEIGKLELAEGAKLDIQGANLTFVYLP